MRGLLYVIYSIPVTLFIGAVHQTSEEPSPLEVPSPFSVQVMLHPQGSVPCVLDPMFFSYAFSWGVAAECVRVGDSLSSLPAQGSDKGPDKLPNSAPAEPHPAVVLMRESIFSKLRSEWMRGVVCATCSPPVTLLIGVAHKGSVQPISSPSLPIELDISDHIVAEDSQPIPAPPPILEIPLQSHSVDVSIANPATSPLHPNSAALVEEKTLTSPTSPSPDIPYLFDENQATGFLSQVSSEMPQANETVKEAPAQIAVDVTPLSEPEPKPKPISELEPTLTLASMQEPVPTPALVLAPTPALVLAPEPPSAQIQTQEKVPAKEPEPEPKPAPILEPISAPVSVLAPAPASVPAPAPAQKPTPVSASIPEPVDSYPLYERDPKAFFSKTIAQNAEPVSIPVKMREERREGHLINFRNAPMSDYIRFVASLTGYNFVYREEDVQFYVTVVSKEPTSLENVVTALLQELRIHGLAVLQQDNNFIIYPALGPLSPAKLLVKEGPNPEIGTRIFQMRYVNAASVQAIMSRMLSDQAIVQVVAESNSLLITDYTTNIERAAGIIEVVDTLSAAYDMGQYVAVNYRIEELIPLAEKILDPLSGGGTPPIFVSQPRTNSAFIIGSSELVMKAFAVLDRLDGREGGTGIFDNARLLELGAERSRAQIPTHLLPPTTLGGIPIGKPGLLPGGALPGALAAPGAIGGGLQEAGALGQARERARLEQEELSNQGDVFINTPEGETLARGTAIPPPPPIPLGGGTPLPPPPRTKFYIYKLEFRRGDQLVAALLSIAESLAYDPTQNKLLLDALNSVQWIEASNSIIVSGVYEAIMKVRDLIQELDSPVRQVLLDMLVLDTSLQESINFSVDTLDRLNGFQLSYAQGFVAAPQGSQFSQINPNVVATQGTIDSSPLVGIQGFNLGIIGRHIFHNGTAFSSLAALVRALHTDTTISVVINPKIVVEDNFPASIFVGQNTAFQTQSIANNNGNILTNNVEYRDVGVSLKVTPQIGNGNVITLVIDQEVSSVVSTTGGGNAGGTQAVSIPVAQTTNKATTVTKVHVPDGYFVVLSGMVREDKQFSRSQTPCIGGIPIIGALFSSQTDTVTKRNYMIFIRPKIVECEVYVEETRRNQDILDIKNSARPRWKYEADEALDFLNLPRFNEPNDFSCTPLGSLGPCQSCCSPNNCGSCSSCGSQGCCLDCGFCGCCGCCK